MRPARPQSPTPYAGRARRVLDPAADVVALVAIVVLLVVLAGRGL